MSIRLQTFSILCGSISFSGSSAPSIASTSTPASPSATHGTVQTTTGLSSEQVSSILAVLASFGLDADTMAKVQTALEDTPPVQHQVLNISRNLSLHSTGADVTALQQFLSVSPTGYFGVKTYTALIKFQKANGITPSGYFGPLTRAKIAEF